MITIIPVEPMAPEPVPQKHVGLGELAGGGGLEEPPPVIVVLCLTRNRGHVQC